MLTMRLGIGGDEPRRKQAHVPGQANQVDAVLFQAGQNLGIVLGPATAFGDEQRVGQAQFAAAAMPGASATLEIDHSNLNARQPSGADGFGDGEEIRPAAGEQDAEAEGRSVSVRISNATPHKEVIKQRAHHAESNPDRKPTPTRDVP